MHEGGVRKIKISPHLAFGNKGVHGKVPPNAVIICDVEIDRIVDDQFRISCQSERRQIGISHSGEMARNLPRWNFWMNNNGEFSISICHPIPGMTWRHTRKRDYSGKLSKEETDLAFDELKGFSQDKIKDDIIPYEKLWADMREPAGNILREQKTNEICLAISCFKDHVSEFSFYVKEGNSRFSSTILGTLISSILLKPEMQ